ncbi:MAG: nucleotidyltransferase domain-containing protein [Bacteroidetes bacterium]|nr:nucleotidyltransferase domain-containing protein [Bacteroidota bacterium]
MKDTILEKLAGIERDNQVKILFAIESGSRAWGFASPDSDYDVRFVYAHPADHYLSIHDGKENIDLPVDAVLDIGGWDIRRALRYIGKTNAIIYEWYQSPIVYMEHTSLLKELNEIGSDYFSPQAGIHHYLGMTINAYEGSLKGEKVKLKKYFYALRPILAALWIARRGTVPPMEFSYLREMEDDARINVEIDELLRIKATADEKFDYAPNAMLNQYLEDKINEIKTSTKDLRKKETDSTALSALFRKTIYTAHDGR